MTNPNSRSRNEINYAVYVNKEDCANNQIIKLYQIPTSFFAKRGWIVLLIYRYYWKSWVVVNKAHKWEIGRLQNSLSTLYYGISIFCTTTTSDPIKKWTSFLRLGPSNPFIYCLKYIKVSFSKSPFALDLRRWNIFFVGGCYFIIKRKYMRLAIKMIFFL